MKFIYFFVSLLVLALSINLSAAIGRDGNMGGPIRVNKREANVKMNGEEMLHKEMAKKTLKEVLQGSKQKRDWCCEWWECDWDCDCCYD
jgi:hypothetical protein